MDTSWLKIRDLQSMLGKIVVRSNINLIALLNRDWGITRRISSNSLPFLTIECASGTAFATFGAVDGFGFADLFTVEEDFDVYTTYG